MSRKRRITIIATIGLTVLAALYAYWDLAVRRERVELAWIVDDGGTPHVVALERRTGRNDYYLVETIAVPEARRLGRTEVGSERAGQRVAIAGPVFGRHAWLHRGGELSLFDLLSHETVGTLPDADLREPSGPWVDAEGRALIRDARNQALLVDRELVETATTTEPEGRDEACLAALREAEGLFNAEVRGCVDDSAFVQHSATTARADWQASLVAADGQLRWTVPASTLSDEPAAWFGHGVRVDEAVWVSVVEPGWSAGLRFVELDAQTGAVRRNEAL